jgi:hypothetical protein
MGSDPQGLTPVPLSPTGQGAGGLDALLQGLHRLRSEA